jgi:O-antigen ligase
VAVIETAVTVFVALWSMLWPAHSHPETPFVVTVLLSLTGVSLVVTRCAQLPPPGAFLRWSTLGATLVFAGGDRWAGTQSLALCALVIGATWVARHCAAGPGHRAAIAIGASVLGLWSVGQALGGLEGLRPELADVPATFHPGFVARIEGGRGFAAQLFPGHLAALLAMALPLALDRSSSTLWSRARWVAVGAVVAGIVATRSPVGVGLAVLAVLVASDGRTRRWLVPGLVGGVAAMGIVFLRPELLRLQPLVERWDNWWAAVWVWWQQPVAGTGLGGYGTAVHGLESHLANRPSHAHNLLLEWLAEGGLTGLVVAAVLLFWVFRLAWRLRPKNPALAGAVIVVPLHNLVDFSFFNWGVVMPWAVVLGWCLAELEPRRTECRLEWRTAVSAGVAATLVIAMAAVHWWSIVGMRNAEEMDARSRAVRLERVMMVNPVNAVVRQEVARAWLEAPAPRPGRSVEILRSGRALTPLSSSALDLEAAALLRSGRPTDAVSALWWASALQPHSSERAAVLNTVLDPLRTARPSPVASP